MKSVARRYAIGVMVLVLWALCPADAALAREHVPTPPGGGEGVSVLPADQLNPGQGAVSRPRSYDWFAYAAPLLDKSRAGDLGGDDVDVYTMINAQVADLAIATNGDLFAAIAYYTSDEVCHIIVRRSDDGGTTWRTWGQIPGPSGGQEYRRPSLHVAEGDADRCFIAYVVDTGNYNECELHVAWSPLDLESADFSNDTVIYTSDRHIDEPSLTSDAVQFGEYYLYVAFCAAADLDSGADIFFARSIDQGTTWESSYAIGTISVEDRGYYDPDITVGYGGYVHVVWNLAFDEPSVYDGAIRYRRASSYAAGGLSSWGTIASMTSYTNDVHESRPQVTASWISPDIMVAWERWISSPVVDGNGTVTSGDSGATWGVTTNIGANHEWLGDLEYQESTGRWIMAVHASFESGFRWAPVATPSAWSENVVFADGSYPSGAPSIVFDPSRSGQIAMLSGRRIDDEEFRYWFDAEWRADPGYPNYEPGFPLDLAAAPLSPPAVVDVDGDGDLEIVFSDVAHRIQVIKPDGSDADGWPVDVGVALSDGPVAVGDLSGDGVPIVVVGATDGQAYAYDCAGNLLPGWPSAITPPGHDIYVSIGAVGPPYPRCIICAGANYITLRNSRGVNPPGGVGWSTSSNTFAAPAAIGDIDDDGVPEVVAGLGTTVFAYEKGAYSREFVVNLPSALSDALTLGDLDLDGDLEILCPTVSGLLYVLDHDGVEVGGNFPYDSGAGVALTSASIAQCRSTSQPEIALADLHWSVHLLWYDGDPVNDYPVDTTISWFLYGAPIIGQVGRAVTSDVVIGDRGTDAWAWDNAGNRIPGWPKNLADKVNVSPALGDIDQDGSTEIVLLTDSQLAIVDVVTPMNDADETWAMYGHDPRRSGCADCPEDLITAVDPGATDGAITRVSFSGASPNPLSGPTDFAFAVPARAAVNLEIIDLRGRRLYTVLREELDAGARVVTWHGRDRRGEPVASGQYFARLTVRGPGLHEVLTRKVTVIR